MRRGIVILGVIITVIAAFMYIVGTRCYQGAYYNKMLDFTQSGRYDVQLETCGAMAGWGFILLFVGIPIAVIGAIVKGNEQKRVPIQPMVITKFEPDEESPEQIIRRRYAKGEITKEQYEQMTKDLNE